jgi:hypothetical protein
MIGALATLFAGCSAPPIVQPVIDARQSDGPALRVEFWHHLSGQPLASHGDAVHALLLFLDGQDPSSGYDQSLATLKARGILPGSFEGRAQTPIDRGTLAVALARALKLKGGLTFSIAGMSPRYAIRELEFRQLYPPSSPNQYFTGAELLGIFGAAEDYRRADPATYPQAVLAAAEPTEPTPALASDEMQSTGADALTLETWSEPRYLDDTPPDPRTTVGYGEAVVTLVRGGAQIRTAPGQPWRAPRVGDILKEGAQLRTDLYGEVQAFALPNQFVYADRLSTLTFQRVQANLQQKKVELTVEMATGRGALVVNHAGEGDPPPAPRARVAATTRAATAPTSSRYPYEDVQIDTVTTIVSPRARLAVGGTRVTLRDERPFPPLAVSLTGRAEFRNLKRQAVAFGARGRQTRVGGEHASAAEYAYERSYTDPRLPGARTEAESELLATLISRGSVVTLDPITGQRIVRGGTPPSDGQLVSSLPGRLDFSVRWNSDTNIDLVVGSPATAQNPGGELLYPAPGLDAVTSGGRTAFDHRGGPKGGIEVAFWTKSYPDGIYAVAAYNLGPRTTQVNFQAFVNKELISPFVGDETRTVAAQNSAIVLYQLDPPSPFATAAAVSRSIPARLRLAPDFRPPQGVGPVAPRTR